MSFTTGQKWAEAILIHESYLQEVDIRKIKEEIGVFYNRSGAIYHRCHDKLLSSLDLKKSLRDGNILKKYENYFVSWLTKHSTNQINGIEKFEADIMQGSTQVFDHWHAKHKNRRIVCLRGEYPYHAIVCRDLKMDYHEFESVDELKENDAFVVSLPNYDTGNMPTNLVEILDRCETLNIPVLLDCVWYTIASDIVIPADHPSVEVVAFSLSKTFPVAYARCGLRLSKADYSDGAKMHSKIDYNNRLSAAVGLSFMMEYPSDWVIHKFGTLRDRICEKLDLIPTSCVSVCHGKEQWKEYNTFYKEGFRKKYDLNASALQSSVIKLGIQRLLENDNFVSKWCDSDEQVAKDIKEFIKLIQKSKKINYE